MQHSTLDEATGWGPTGSVGAIQHGLNRALVLQVPHARHSTTTTSEKLNLNLEHTC